MKNKKQLIVLEDTETVGKMIRRAVDEEWRDLEILPLVRGKEKNFEHQFRLVKAACSNLCLRVSVVRSLRRLRLYSMWIRDQDVIVLESLPNLRELYLEENELGDEGAKAISKFPQLEEVYLSGNNIGKVGAWALADHPSLISLDLSRNYIMEAGARVLLNN